MAKNKIIKIIAVIWLSIVGLGLLIMIDIAFANGTHNWMGFLIFPGVIIVLGFTVFCIDRFLNG